MFTILINSIGFVFFLALAVYCQRHKEMWRDYLPGLILISASSLSGLVRGFYFETCHRTLSESAESGGFPKL